MNAEQRFDNVEDMFKEAEETFRKGVGTLSTWTDQARELISSKPQLILAAVGVSGFVMGSLIRHGFSARRALRSGADVTPNTLPGFSEQSLPADPFVLFVAGVVAGAVAGPRIIQEALSGIDRFAGTSEDKIIGIDSSSRRGHTPRDERPFEKI